VGVAVDREKIFVGGEFIEEADGGWREVLNPATGKAIAEVPECSAEDVDRAVGAPRRAFEGWFDTTPAERSRMLHTLADAPEDNAEALAQVESRNVGKPISSAREELPYIVDNLRFFAGVGRHIEGKSAGEYLRGYTSMIRREPVGVVGQIAPWNYPLMMAVWKIGPALAAGNTVVLKPSEQTPLTTLRMAELAAGIFPGGVLNVITGDLCMTWAWPQVSTPRMASYSTPSSQLCTVRSRWPSSGAGPMAGWPCSSPSRYLLLGRRPFRTQQSHSPRSIMPGGGLSFS
jgi:acyl-CoA reductase-like NAD-dependent aldehyde dehydrogenase